MAGPMNQCTNDCNDCGDEIDNAYFFREGDEKIPCCRACVNQRRANMYARRLTASDAKQARYLAALKAEACNSEIFVGPCVGDSACVRVGGITFRVTRNPDGTLQADEVTE